MPKGPQRTKYSMSESHLGNSQKGISSYTLYSHSPRNRKKTSPVGSVFVESYPGRGQTSPAEPMARGEQGKLFEHSQVEKSRTELTGIFTAKSARHMVPTMLGVAQRRSVEHFGQGLSPSRDLSQHSSRLVSHLQDRGVVDSSAPTAVTNFSTWLAEPNSDGYRDRGSMGYDWVPSEDMRQGSQTTRSILRAARPPKSSVMQGQQLHMF